MVNGDRRAVDGDGRDNDRAAKFARSEGGADVCGQMDEGDSHGESAHEFGVSGVHTDEVNDASKDEDHTGDECVHLGRLPEGEMADGGYLEIEDRNECVLMGVGCLCVCVCI